MSTILFILLSAVTLLYVHGTYVPNDKNLKTIGIEKRIFGGVDTPIEKTPYQVYLQVNEEQFCGGSIYSTKIIITAAHCVVDQKIRDLYIRAGSSTWNSGGSLIRVSDVVVHGRFEYLKLFGKILPIANDIALLLLSSPLKLGESIKTISLGSSEPKVGATALVSGWGATKWEIRPLYLKSVDVNIWPHDKCNETYSGLFRPTRITEEMICAAAPGKDSCIGDSGGPLVYNNELVGVVSFGPGNCANPYLPGVYVNVAVMRNWIMEEATKLLSTKQ